MKKDLFSTFLTHCLCPSVRNVKQYGEGDVSSFGDNVPNWTAATRQGSALRNFLSGVGYVGARVGGGGGNWRRICRGYASPPHHIFSCCLPLLSSVLSFYIFPSPQMYSPPPCLLPRPSQLPNFTKSHSKIRLYLFHAVG